MGCTLNNKRVKERTGNKDMAVIQLSCCPRHSCLPLISNQHLSGQPHNSGSSCMSPIPCLHQHDGAHLHGMEFLQLLITSLQSNMPSVAGHSCTGKEGSSAHSPSTGGFTSITWSAKSFSCLSLSVQRTAPIFSVVPPPRDKGQAEVSLYVHYPFP